MCFNISASNPTKAFSKKAKNIDPNRGFKLSAEGKVIITEVDDEERPKQAKKRSAQDDENDDIDELLDAMGGPKVIFLWLMMASKISNTEFDSQNHLK